MCEDDPQTPSSLDRDPVEELAEEFLLRRRRGEAVSVTEYAQKHPQWAERIRDLFPTLLLMEELKPDSTSSRAGRSEPFGEAAIQRLGDFRILREIGRGGMGVVYEAEQESLGRHVALKVLPATCVSSPTRLRRFQREAQAAARLHHTNIVPVFGVGHQDDVHYYVMQFIPGQGLDRVLGALNPRTASPSTDTWRDSTLVPKAPEPAELQETFSAVEAAHLLLAGPSTADGPPAEPAPSEPAIRRVPTTIPTDHRYWRSVARIGVQVADALEYAHRQGTLHRDVKPANLLLDRGGTVWIADFGLAKLADFDDLTRSGDMVGTLRYMAPEQFEGNADARSDVYSLGLTLYELLTRRPAFDEQDRRRLIRQVTQEEPPRPRKIAPAIPRDLETIVVKAIASNPSHRYQSAGELAADLRCFLEDRPIRARRITPVGRAWRWCRRNRAVAALTGTAVLLLVAVAVVASVGYLRTKDALARVSQEREHAQRARGQAESERTRASAERERAEANLRLATKAFEDIFSKVGAEPVAPIAETDEESEWPEPAWGAMVTDKDAALLESMLKFYDQFAQQNQADVKLQQETARAYRRVGDIQRRLGQYEKAETAYRHALATYQRLADASPDSGEYLRAIAAIYNELGVVFRHSGRFPESNDFHRQALKTLQRQSPQAAASPESRFELARTYSFLSSTFFGRRSGRSSSGSRHSGGPRGRDGEARENNRRALEIFEQLTREAPENPRYRLAMAQGLRDRYRISIFSQRAEEADQARQQSVAILEKLVADFPNNPEYRFELAETYAMLFLRPRDAAVAEDVVKQYRRALEIGSDLVTRWPTVSEYRASSARWHLRFAELQRQRSSLEEAETHFAKAVELYRGLMDESPKVAAYPFFLARALDQLADVQSARREPSKARASLEEAVTLLKKMQESSPELPPLRMMLAGEYVKLAKVLRELGENALADEAAAKAGPLSGHRGPPGFGPRRPERDQLEPPR